MVRPILSFLFPRTFRSTSCGRLLLDASVPDEHGFAIGRFQGSNGPQLLRVVGAGLLVAAVGLELLDQRALAVGALIIGTGCLILSVWPSRSFVEFREFAVVTESDLPGGPEGGDGPELVYYEWLQDVRWDEEGRLVLALEDLGFLAALPRFVRVRIPVELRTEVSRILWERIGKSREELELEFRRPKG